jgi:UDP-GlcNAc:undecaprenyl-phosphate GlcNAc-1-phosphate transferase
MGDAGGLFLGFLAGASTALLSNLAAAHPGAPVPHGLAPLVILALPAYDLVTVVAGRLRRGRPPWVGDTNHISHRLVRLGLSRRGAVLLLCALCATLAVPASVALLLPGPAAWIPLVGAMAWLAALGLLDRRGSRRRRGPVRPA